MSLTQDVEVLRNIPLFAKVEPAKLKLLAFTSERLQYLAGDELEYAPPRFEEPIYVKTQNFPWAATAHEGVSVKHLAYFGERGPNVSILRLEPGAKTPSGRVGCIEMRLVKEGGVEYEGKPCPAVSRLYFPPNASFGEMISQLAPLGVRVPDGFALTADAYRAVLAQLGVGKAVHDAIAHLDPRDVDALRTAGAAARKAVGDEKSPVRWLIVGVVDEKEPGVPI